MQIRIFSCFLFNYEGFKPQKAALVLSSSFCDDSSSSKSTTTTTTTAAIHAMRLDSPVCVGVANRKSVSQIQCDLFFRG